MKEKVNRYRLKSYKDIELEEVNWLWFPYFPLGKISMIVGDPGSGKTTISIFLASIISNGGKFPLSDTNIEQGIVIIQNGEDGAGDTIKKRLISFHANEENVYMIDTKQEYENVRGINLNDTSELEELLKEKQPKLVVFDPIQSFIGNIDMNSANKVRAVLKPIGKLAEKYNCSIIFIAHRNKGMTGVADLYRVLGSIDFVGYARSVITIAKGKDEMLFIHTKSNLAERGKALAFKLENNNIEWLGERDYNEEQQTINETKRPRDIAKDFILAYLTEHKKSEFKNMTINAEKLGISEKTLDRAKDDLRDDNIIAKKKENNIWYWYLVDSNSPNPHI